MFAEMLSGNHLDIFSHTKKELQGLAEDPNWSMTVPTIVIHNLDSTNFFDPDNYSMNDLAALDLAIEGKISSIRTRSHIYLFSKNGVENFDTVMFKIEPKLSKKESGVELKTFVWENMIRANFFRQRRVSDNTMIAQYIDIYSRNWFFMAMPRTLAKKLIPFMRTEWVSDIKVLSDMSEVKELEVNMVPCPVCKGSMRVPSEQEEITCIYCGNEFINPNL